MAPKVPYKNDYEAWFATDPSDLWVFDKLILSRICGYSCGPRGARVPRPDKYIVRPISNFEGMGQGAHIQFLEYETMDLPHGFFWSEIFIGPHLSVDYTDGEPVLTVSGTHDKERPLQRFSYWVKIPNTIPLPDFLVDISRRYRFINCEFIGGKLIEVHLRHNPDFSHGNTEMIPVWPGESTVTPYGFRYIPDTDEEDRVGIFVN
jgi:hypothetical protein